MKALSPKTICAAVLELEADEFLRAFHSQGAMFADIKQLVAEYIRDKKIAQLEQALDEELLGFGFHG